MFEYNEEGQIIYYNSFEITSALMKKLLDADFASFIELLKQAGYNFLSWYLLFVTILSIILILLVVVLYKRVAELTSVYSIGSDVLAAGEDIPISKSTERWEHVMELLGSDNPNDWRLSVLEADIMLDELVTKMGYKGETLGDKMKNIEKADFRTLDAAWEAHKIRNIIAHRGSDYVLTQRETRRTIDLFARVFEEFHYI